MSRILRQRRTITAITILLGVIILEGVQYFLRQSSPPWLSFLVVLLIGLLIALIVIPIDSRLSKLAQSLDNKSSERLRLETELFKINQELVSRSQEQTTELARLNVELQLQMAMYKQAEETALTNEERFRNMADNIQEGLTIIENGRVVYVNDRACEIFGDCPDGEIESRIHTFAAPEERARLRQLIQQAKQSEEFPRELEYWTQRQDGSRRCIRERYSNSTNDGVTRTFIVTSDITESVQAYQILETTVSDRTHELSTVLDISQKISSTLELEPLLNLVLDQIQTIIPYSGAAIFTLADEKLTAVAYQIPGLATQNHQLFLSLARAGPYRPVVLEKKVLIFDDVKGDPPLALAFQESSDNLETVSFSHARSYIGIPLVVRDQVIGLLSLAHSEPNYYTQRHARLATTIANQIAIAIENARLYEQAQNLAVLEERHRIARELHDSVTQLLYGISLYCTATSRSIRSGNYHQLEQKLDEIKQNALQALQEMRLLILELDPPMLQKAGLVAALEASLEVIETRTGLDAELKTKGVNRLPRAIETELYRIAMEALNNLVRYAQAKKVSVELVATDSWVCMEIFDNGVGFNLAQARNSGGMGLHSMEQRARQIGGELEIISNPGEGTHIKLQAPLSM